MKLFLAPDVSPALHRDNPARILSTSLFKVQSWTILSTIAMIPKVVCFNPPLGVKPRSFLLKGGGGPEMGPKNHCTSCDAVEGLGTFPGT